MCDYPTFFDSEVIIMIIVNTAIVHRFFEIRQYCQITHNHDNQNVRYMAF